MRLTLEPVFSRLLSMCLKNERLGLLSIGPARMRFCEPGRWLPPAAANAGRGPSAYTGNCRDLILLGIGTGPVNLTRLAAVARSESRRSVLTPSAAGEDDQSGVRRQADDESRSGSPLRRIAETHSAAMYGRVWGAPNEQADGTPRCGSCLCPCDCC